MARNSKFGFTRKRTAAWAGGLILLTALFVALFHRTTLPVSGSHPRDARPSLPANGRSAIFASNERSEVRNYFLDFAGDHSLDVATVIEQPSAGYAKYTVHLHLASGVEQSVVVAAPPGGLQVEMHDMTGDKIQNDVVLRPALVRWLPTVLVNDGHEHFEIAISATDPRTFSSSEDLGSRSRDSQTFALLMSSGFKAIHLPNTRRLSNPQLRECLFSTFTQTVANRLGHRTTPERAPPFVTAT
jgi:hypothetical protein